MIAFCIDNRNNIIYLREINNGIICIKQKFFLLITPRIIIILLMYDTVKIKSIVYVL